MEERRRFQRLSITEHAYAIDDAGRQLGRVSLASGGGIQVQADSVAVAQQLSVGQKLRITVVEPGPDTRHTMDMIVRSREGTTIGLEFITGPAGS